MKNISLKDISERLNISKATISYVLNGRGDEKRISKGTQEKIIKFANEHNYKANQLARGLSRGKSDMIGLVVPNISDSFFARIARRIENIAEESGYGVLFSSTGENSVRETKIIQSMLDRQVDGLIIVSSQENEEDILRLKEKNFPFVLIDRKYPGIETNFVGFHNREGISHAVEQLMRMGRKRIGFVSLKMDLGTLQEREEGYVQTMEKYKLCVEEGFIQKLNYGHNCSEISKVMHEMLQEQCGIDAIVFATHFLAVEGLRELKEMNVVVPDDIAIVSYGQKNDFDLFEPAITSVRLPINEMGDKAVEILLHNINASDTPFEDLRFKTKLCIRKSCGTN